VTVVTSDRGLAERVTDAGAAVRGARWVLELLDA
jgi:8-oxo-dGTP diphosphatase